jgi:hypothetical protein
MNTTTYSEALLPLAGTEGAAAPKRNFFLRFIDAIAASNAAKAERELRRIEAAYGISLREAHQKAGFISADLPFSGLRD